MGLGSVTPHHLAKASPLWVWRSYREDVSHPFGMVVKAVRLQSVHELLRVVWSAQNTRHGKQSTGEQAKGSRQINESMEQIRSMISLIDESTRELTKRSRDVVDAVGSVHKVAKNNASRTTELDHVVETLTRLTTALEEEVGVFKI